MTKPGELAGKAVESVEHAAKGAVGGAVTWAKTLVPLAPEWQDTLAGKEAQPDLVWEQTPEQRRALASLAAKYTATAPTAKGAAVRPPAGPLPTPEALESAVAALAAANPAAPAVVDAADVALYRQLAQAAQALEALQPEKQAVDERHKKQALVRALAEERKPLPRMEELVREEAEELERVNGYYVGKYILGAERREATLAEHHEELAYLKQTRDAQLARVERVKQKLADSQKAATAWQAKVMELHSAKRAQQEVLARIMAAPGWAGSEHLLLMQEQTSMV